MRKHGHFLLVVELSVILLVGLAASYALFGVSIYSLITLVSLLLLGLVTIIFFPISSIFFGAGAILITLPALMKLNGVKWWLFSPERLNFCPTLSFPAALAIGLLIISGSLLLGYIQPLQRELRTLQRNGAEAEQALDYASNQTLAAGGAILVSAVLAMAIAFVIGMALSNLTVRFSQLPLWTLPVASLAFLAMLALAIFWLIGSRRTR
jgi:hypothetical protein